MFIIMMRLCYFNYNLTYKILYKGYMIYLMFKYLDCIEADFLFLKLRLRFRAV